MLVVLKFSNEMAGRFWGDWGLSNFKNKQGLQEDGNESSTTVVCRSLVVVVVVVVDS